MGIRPMSESKKGIDAETVKRLEASKKAVLKRVAENLKSQVQDGSVTASHSSHSSGAGRTHASYIN
jgi:hypothetical protein